MATLSARYAAALLELCQERGGLDASLEQAALLLPAIRSEECQSILNHPLVSIRDKSLFLQNTFGQSIDSDLMGFLQLAVQKGRTAHIAPALETFLTMGKRSLGNVAANVVSATPLTQDQLARIRDILAQRLNKRVEIHASTDPALIGGLYIHVDGYLIDHTIKKRLIDMRENLKRRSGRYDSSAR